MKLHGEGARLRRLWRPFVTRRYLTTTDEPRLHVGCGGRNVPGWLNVDKFAANADTYLNAYRHFPFSDNTFSKVFSEHMIEHLYLDGVHHFLSEVYRVLRPDGVFRVTCPDLELYAHRYVENDQTFFDQVLQGIKEKRRKHPELTWVVRSKGGAFMTSAVPNFHKHRWMYDFETLEACLQEVGFSEVVKQAFRESIDVELAEMDNPDRTFETLYVDAIKG